MTQQHKHKERATMDTIVPSDDLREPRLSLGTQLDTLPHQVVPDESFDDYVNHMSDSVSQFEEVPSLSEKRVSIHEDPPILVQGDEDDGVGSSNEAPNSNSNNSMREDQWTPKRSFLAESPYFSAFVEKEMHELGTVTSILNDISARTKAFTKYGSLMAEATHSLSLSCRLRREEAAREEMKYSPRQMDEEMEKRRQAIGPEMSDLLGILGESLEEIAHAQMTMCRIFDATLAKALDSFVEADLRGVNMLKAEADSQTVLAEQMLFKYITGRPTISTTRDEESESNVAKFTHDSSPSKSSFSRLWSREGSGSKSATGDPALDKAINAANWRLNLEEIRLNQATAELKRFQFTKLLLDVKNRRNLELSEGAVSSAQAMSAYFQSSQDRMAGSLSTMVKIEERQRDARKSHQRVEMPVWLERMNLIVRVLSDFQSSAAEASQVAYAVTGGDPVLIDKQTTNVKSIENEVAFWDVPAVLAKSSRYRREAPVGVLHEGWLYQKIPSMLSLNTWNRRWFMLRKDGIYCLESSAELKRENTGHSTTKVKICDVVLCTVRELPDDINGRFRFELIAPRQKPLLLMARGPTEMQAWAKAIRNAVEKQLVHGDPESQSLNQNIGKLKKDRRSTEIAMTVFKKESPLSMENAILEEMSEEEEEEDDEEGHTKRSPLVKMVLSENSTCADCGKKKPDWVSLNLGILVCLECSGVHRSLGSHVSKVRSLTLDSLSDNEAKLLLALGNNIANGIWEDALESEEDMLDESADRDTRMKWIKSKYITKDFIKSDGNAKDKETINRELYEAAKEGRLLAAATALAHGADVEWKNEEDGMTALHACAVSPRPDDGNEWLGIECAELLIQNGADMKVLNKSSHNVLDCAVLGNADRDMVEYLSTKFE